MSAVTAQVVARWCILPVRLARVSARSAASNVPCSRFFTVSDGSVTVSVDSEEMDVMMFYRYYRDVTSSAWGAT